MERSMSFNQITLITDGFSNQGISPVEAARRALSYDITVNVIGITDGQHMGIQGQAEIEDIAQAGGGLYQLVPVEKIAKTVQMVTRKAVNKTIQQVVNKQLIEILGKEDITSIPPSERMKVVQMMDNIAEHSGLNILLLIDQSASMSKKMDKVKEAIFDFQISMQSRAGLSTLSILTFPGEMNVVDIKIPWTSEISTIENLIYHMRPKGGTPTGPAILSSIQYFNQLKNNTKKHGVLDEYII